MNKNKVCISTSDLVKHIAPAFPGEVLVAGHDGIRSVPFDELDERTRNKFSKHREQIENYEPCFEFSGEYEFIKPPKSTINQ